MTALVVGAARSGVALAIHLTREGHKVRVVDRKPAEVPVESIQSGPLLLRLLRQTVFDRRPRVQLVDDDLAS